MIRRSPSSGHLIWQRLPFVDLANRKSRFGIPFSSLPSWLRLSCPIHQTSDRILPAESQRSSHKHRGHSSFVPWRSSALRPRPAFSEVHFSYTLELLIESLTTYIKEISRYPPLHRNRIS